MKQLIESLKIISHIVILVYHFHIRATIYTCNVSFYILGSIYTHLDIKQIKPILHINNPLIKYGCILLDECNQ